MRPPKGYKDYLPRLTGQVKTVNGAHFLPLRRFPSVPLVSAPLNSSPLLTAVGFLAFGFLRWCSGIHSSSYLAPLEVTVTVLTGALAPGRPRLDRLDLVEGK